MTLKEIQDRVKRISEMVSDDEGAHCEEDRLREDFIQHIVECGAEFSKMAKLVLSTNSFDFCRWGA